MDRPEHPAAWLPDEWRAALAEWGEKPYRAGQIFKWIQARGVLDPAAMTDLPKALRARLADAGLGAPGQVRREHRSEDGTRKLLVELDGGLAVETVLLPAARAADDADAAAVDDDPEPEAPGGRRLRAASRRVTQCISTQVGCAMGCVFCASGVAGLKRHMTAAEIVGQVLLAKRALDEEERLRHVVFMGMGEPLHNFNHTVRAIELLTHPDGIALNPRRITVSTSGLVPEIAKLGEAFGGEIALAVSLHQADDEKRSALMPINDRYPLRELVRALRAYPLAPRRRITIEYTLVEGQNDGRDDAERLAKLLRGLRVRINLIPMNPIEHSALGPPEDGRVGRFQKLLRDAGYLCFVRRRRGDDVSAACGQLALEGEGPNARFLRRQPDRD